MWLGTTRLAKFHHTKQKTPLKTTHPPQKTKKRTFFFHDPDRVHARNSAPGILTPMMGAVPNIGSIRSELKALLPNDSNEI